MTQPLTSALTSAQVIRGGMKLIQERGWCQNRLQDEQGRLCLIGALVTQVGAEILNETNWISAHHFGYTLALNSAFASIEEVAKAEGYRDAVGLNDNDTSTKEHVLAVMEKAAINLEATVDP